jgi:predicted O-methyltransferase YrrM
MAVEQANVKGWGKTPFVEERSAPRPECENPDRWTAIDQVTAEVEVLKFIRSLVRTVKPKSVVVCGDPSGELSRFVGHALRENGFGNMVICGYTDEAKDKIIGRVMGSGLGRWTTILEDGAMDVGSDLEFVVIDGEAEQTRKHIEHFKYLLRDDGLLIAHDVQTQQEEVDQFQHLHLPTPRGLSIIQRK